MAAKPKAGFEVAIRVAASANAGELRADLSQVAGVLRCAHTTRACTGAETYVRVAKLWAALLLV